MGSLHNNDELFNHYNKFWRCDYEHQQLKIRRNGFDTVKMASELSPLWLVMLMRT